MTTDKKELRKLIRQRKRQFSDSQLQELSFAVTESLVAHPRIKEAKVVMAYCSLADEVYTRSLIDKLRAMGKIVVLPVVLDDTRMEVRIYNDANDLRRSLWHKRTCRYTLRRNRKHRSGYSARHGFR